MALALGLVTFSLALAAPPAAAIQPCDFNLIDEGGVLLVRCGAGGSNLCVGVIYNGQVVILSAC